MTPSQTYFQPPFAGFDSVIPQTKKTWKKQSLLFFSFLFCSHERAALITSPSLLSRQLWPDRVLPQIDQLVDALP